MTGTLTLSARTRNLSAVGIGSSISLLHILDLAGLAESPLPKVEISRDANNMPR